MNALVIQFFAFETSNMNSSVVRQILKNFAEVHAKAIYLESNSYNARSFFSPLAIIYKTPLLGFMQFNY